MGKKIRKKYFLICLFLVILFFSFYGTSWFQAVLNQALKISAPIEKKAYQLGESLFSFLNYSRLAKENSRLREEVSRLAIDYIEQQTLSQENTYLRRELDFLRAKKFVFVLTDVIGRQPDNDQILILDQGSSAGLEVNLPVTVGHGIMIGKIIKVETNRAWAELLTSPESSAAASLATLSGTNGLINGQIGNNLLLESIPQDKEIKEQDLVITSGLEEKIPRGLLVGYVIEVESLAGQVFKRARIEPAINYHNLQILTVIKGF